jgi:hypothetical protein
MSLVTFVWGTTKKLLKSLSFTSSQSSIDSIFSLVWESNTFLWCYLHYTNFKSKNSITVIRFSTQNSPSLCMEPLTILLFFELLLRLFCWCCSMYFESFDCKKVNVDHKKILPYRKNMPYKNILDEKHNSKLLMILVLNYSSKP